MKTRFTLILTTLLALALPHIAAAQSADRGEVYIHVVQPYGWDAGASHLVIYPVGGGYLVSRYTSFTGSYVGRLHAGRYLVNAHGYGGGYGTSEFVVSPGESSNVTVTLIGTAFTRFHHRHRLGLWHALHRLHRDRVMLAIHQHQALPRSTSVRTVHTLHASPLDRANAPSKVPTDARSSNPTDEWDHLAHTAETPAASLPQPIHIASPSPGSFGPARTTTPNNGNNHAPGSIQVPGRLPQ